MNENSLINGVSGAAKYLGVSRRTVYLWLRDRDFPKPHRLSPRKQVWYRNEIDSWITKSKEEENDRSSNKAAANRPDVRSVGADAQQAG